MRERVAARFPRLGAPLPPALGLSLLVAIVAAGLVVFWVKADDVVRLYLVAGVVAGGVGLVLVIWNEL